MRLIVQKYGGTSVANPERIRNVARRLIETQREGCRVVAVISAMAGVTDELIRLAQEVAQNPTGRELDVLLATGEHTATALTAIAVNALGGRAISLTGAEAGILTDRVHTKAKIATAIALAGALNADACQIFTDVDGVFTCDPRVVADAKKLDEIAYDELLEMAGAGSKVMQSRAVEFAKKFGIPFEVRSSFEAKPGTIAKEETPNMEDVVVRGVSTDRKQAKVTIAGVPDQPGIASRIFAAVSAANIIVDMIVQNISSDGTTDISFTIHESELGQTERLLQPVVGEIGAVGLMARSGVAKLSVVGIGMRSHSGVAARLFDCLGKGGINIQLISTSDIKIAVIIDESELERAAQLTHQTFGLARLAPSVGLAAATIS